MFYFIHVQGQNALMTLLHLADDVCIVCICSMYVCGNLQNWSLYPHTLMYCHGTWTQWSLGRVTHVTSTDMGSKVIYGSMTFGSSFWKKGSVYPHWCIFKSIKYYNDCKSTWSRKQARLVVREPPCWQSVDAILKDVSVTKSIVWC